MIAHETSTVVVRPAELSDLPWIKVELTEFSRFFNSKIPLYHGPQTDYATTYQEIFLENMIKDHLFLIAESEIERQGLIVGVVGHHPFNPEIKTLDELFWWVPEKHRNTRAGALLLREFVKWGEENVDWIVATVEDNSPVNGETFLKRGFIPKEISYLKEIV